MTIAEKILCVVDVDAERHPEIDRAAWMAGRVEASLELFSVGYNDYVLGHPLFDQKLVEQARSRSIEQNRERLEVLAGPLRDAGLTVTVSASWDHPLHEAVARRLSAHGGDIVVKCAGHHSAFDITSLSNSDWNLIRTCPAPLWLVKDVPLSTSRHVIAAVDPLHRHDKPASLDDAILRMSTEIAAALGGEVHAFHACDPGLMATLSELNSYVGSSMRIDDLGRELESQHRKRFTELTDFHHIPGERAHLVKGIVHRELPALARQIDASLVVTGAINRRIPQRVFVGSTAERTLGQLGCDLLVVKPDWFRSEVPLRVQDVA